MKKSSIYDYYKYVVMLPIDSSVNNGELRQGPFGQSTPNYGEDQVTGLSISVLEEKSNANYKGMCFFDNVILSDGKTNVIRANFDGKDVGFSMEQSDINVATGEYITKTHLLKLEESAVKVKVGKTLKIKAKTGNNAKITYLSTNDKIAKVSSKGTILGVKKGTTIIKVTANGITKKISVSVK